MKKQQEGVRLQKEHSRPWGREEQTDFCPTLLLFSEDPRRRNGVWGQISGCFSPSLGYKEEEKTDVHCPSTHSTSFVHDSLWVSGHSVTPFLPSEVTHNFMFSLGD